MSQPIQFWNRYSKNIETEIVYGQKPMEWAYRNILGRVLTTSVLTKPWFSKAYGFTQDTRWSSRKINSFVEKFKINMSEYQVKPFKNFNEFFIREFKPGARSFCSGKDFPAFAEGRYFIFPQINKDSRVFVKGIRMSLPQILGRKKWIQTFEGGACIIARLCPVDYHRFHFPDNGIIIDHYNAHGPLHSVNPTALAEHDEILATNERVITVLDTKEFGKLAYIEVGAMCVGRIVQTHKLSQEFKRGDEKGYFLFGGSTVIVLTEGNKFKGAQDILDRTSEGMEVYIKLGDIIGRGLL